MIHTRRPSAADDRVAISVTVRNKSAILPATVADLVIAALSPRKRESNPDRRGIRFYRRDRHGRLRLPVGLLPRIQQHLERRSFQVLLQDERPHGVRPVISDLAVQTAPNSLIGKIQQAAAEAMRTALVPGGTIAIQIPRDTADVVAALIRLAPSAKQLVVAKNQRSARTLARRIESQVQLPVTSNTDFLWSDGPQVHVDNMHSFVGRSVEDWRVVIVADPESARAKTVIDQVQYMDQSCVFAVLPAACRFDAEDQLRLEMLCGPEIFRQRDDASVLTAVEVAWLDPAAYPAAQPTDPLERKRLYFLENPRRNQQLANAALAARAVDMPKLRQVNLHDACTLQAAHQERRQPRVCILVESPEHASILGKLLPGWERIRAQDTDPVEPRLPLMPDQAIVTIPRAYSQGLAADVVIRAAGTEQGWKPSFGPHAGINGPHMLIIDVQDDVDERARLDCERRFQDYAQRAWHVSRAAN